MGAPTLDVTEAPAAADVALIERELSAYNVERSIPYDRRPLCVLVRDGTGEVLGGATGDTHWGWLTVDCFWLPESLRRGGLGARVLAVLEDEARARGCRRARLYTYSFQAQGFYERQGYAAFGALDDYPPGHRQVWMRKDLDGARGVAPP